MNPIIIANTIADMIEENEAQQIHNVYKKAFDENDLVELFKLRYLFIKEMEEALKHKNNSKSDKRTFESISNALAYPNLTSNLSTIKQNFSPPHISFIENLFENHPSNIIHEVEILNKELKEHINLEEIGTEEKEVILTICDDIDNLKSDYEDKGIIAFVDFIKKLTNKKLSTIKNQKSIEIITKVIKKLLSINEVYNQCNSLITNGLEIFKNIGLLNA